MSTLVCFHAHPDDEAISTGGLMAKASAAGHRVILVCATRGEQGEPQAGVLDPNEELWERRWIEIKKSAEILGAEEPRWLGYEDSGMIGEPTNDNPNCFWQADKTDAISRLVSILTEVEADVLTIYDAHGGYGHPDHIQVHEIGKAAAAATNITNVFEATFNRELSIALMGAEWDQARERGEEVPGGNVDFSETGTPQAQIAYGVEVSSFLTAKRTAMVAHRSQIGPDNIFLKMPDDMFKETLGVEWFNLLNAPQTGGPQIVEFLPGLTVVD